MLKLFRPSGGLVYHWRALRSRSAWRDFTRDLEHFLKSWAKPSGTLVLIGPSGGYTLPSEWLREFAAIHAYDIDPLAPFFFHLRHRGLEAEFHNQDVFWRDRKLSTTGIETCVRAHPGATFLFCNVLGQLPLEHELEEPAFARYLMQMRASLAGQRWASYHDLFTISPLATARHAAPAQAFREQRDFVKEVANAPKVEILDHMLGGEWSAGLIRTRLAWSLNPRSLHLIEAAHA